MFLHLFAGNQQLLTQQLALIVRISGDYLIQKGRVNKKSVFNEINFDDVTFRNPEEYVKGGESILHVCILILNMLATCMTLATMTKFWMWSKEIKEMRMVGDNDHIS